MDHPMIPEKYFYTIGDVSQLTGTKPHILRYWESQFKLLRPARRYSGHRKYTKREIDLINRIKFLVVDRRFTLAGAKREINRQQTGRVPDSTAPVAAATAVQTAEPLLREIKKDIDECLALLKPEPAQQELIRF
jgi:DNA-binding transcriptional MerR regulator